MSDTQKRVALFVVDVQYDFLPPDGSLAVTDADAILPVVKEMLGWKWDYVIASQDFHPPGHVSFASTHEGCVPFTTIEVPNPYAKEFQDQPAKVQQMLWPDHCVQGTWGCEIEESVKPGIDDFVRRGQGRIEQKGTNPLLDAYSAFSNFPPSTYPTPSNSLLTEYLAANSIDTLYVVGIATDYCVRATVLDAKDVKTCVKDVFVVKEAVRAVGGEDATEKVFGEMRARGVNLVSLNEVREKFS